jgi:hypothetical protein
MKLEIILEERKFFSVLLTVGFLISGCAGPIRTVSVDNSLETGTKEITCKYPFSTTNPVALMIFYKDGMHYITHSSDTCRHAFANELRNDVKSSALIPDGCIKATLRDIEDALYNPEELRKRLKYY